MREVGTIAPAALPPITPLDQIFVEFGVPSIDIVSTPRLATA